MALGTPTGAPPGDRHSSFFPVAAGWAYQPRTLTEDRPIPLRPEEAERKGKETYAVLLGVK